MQILVVVATKQMRCNNSSKLCWLKWSKVSCEQHLVTSDSVLIRLRENRSEMGRGSCFVVLLFFLCFAEEGGRMRDLAQHLSSAEKGKQVKIPAAHTGQFLKSGRESNLSFWVWEYGGNANEPFYLSRGLWKSFLFFLTACINLQSGGVSVCGG